MSVRDLNTLLQAFLSGNPLYETSNQTLNDTPFFSIDHSENISYGRYFLIPFLFSAQIQNAILNFYVSTKF